MQQLRLTDLVPRRNSALFALFLGGVAIVGGLEWLHTCQTRLAPLTTDGHVAAFDLDGEGSLAVWFSTATLELAALTALLAWAIRRRTPASRGQNALLIAAACWLVMSIDECASVHEAFKELMAHSTGHRLLGDGTIWWVMGYGLVLSAVGLRLLWEFRRSWDAAGWLLATAAVYALAVVAELEWIIPNKGQTSVMLEEGCEMIGNLCLLLSMVCHARWAVKRAELSANGSLHTVRGVVRNAA
ncbi:MAG TPA: hypothetical protein VJ783_19795 [Pirellulales bacterium]|nr:hypothetical protein [Pirellulales bacterium]